MSVALRWAMPSARWRLSLGRLCFLLLFQLGPALPVLLDRGVALQRRLLLDAQQCRARRSISAPTWWISVELLGRQQPVGHQSTVDEPGALILDGWDQVAPAEPGIAPQGRLLRRLL